MKRIVFVGFAILLLLSAGCNDKNDENAKAYLADARSLFHNGVYDEALGKIDSICQVAPKAYGWITEGEYLSDSITRKINSVKVDSLIAIENDYKRQMYIEMRQSENQDEIQKKWELKIDSIKELKKMPYSIISQINAKEGKRLASCQCITAIRQR